MTSLQADVDALQTLVSMIKAGNFGGWDKSWRAATHLKTKDALPAIERLLGIVSAVEKLEAMLRANNDLLEPAQTDARLRIADHIKRLLHFEDETMEEHVRRVSSDLMPTPGGKP